MDIDYYISGNALIPLKGEAVGVGEKAVLFCGYEFGFGEDGFLNDEIADVFVTKTGAVSLSRYGTSWYFQQKNNGHRLLNANRTANIKSEEQKVSSLPLDLVVLIANESERTEKWKTPADPNDITFHLTRGINHPQIAELAKKISTAEYRVNRKSGLDAIYQDMINFLKERGFEIQSHPI